uniref:Acetyl-coenzyme A carboxylase carboxyl transferase subunit beta, chloroplastic n=1 Tax=Sparganium fallax TaxID=1073915 RepID=A0A8K1WZW4_9POAL|nr:acetyl-CoA carboxylase carboxyltransferase beta subunit [Sparganium confertum]UGV20175.1 acetyl-CoA carboxylase carboxyltransferase beta subunit [Sparganium fallax]ULQ67729.1 acetyl-CoA carboxylase carboxyltransferase beta subunit [Sparganium confertum]
MKKWWFNSMLSNDKLEYRCGRSKSMKSRDGIGHVNGSEEPIINDRDKNISSWSDSGSYSFNNIDYLFAIRNLISDDTFLVKDSNGDSYSVYFNMENKSFEIANESFFLNKLEHNFSSFLNRGFKKNNRYYYHYMYDTQSSWNNYINSSIESYLRFEVSINSFMLGGTDNSSDSYIYNFICTENISGTKSIISGSESRSSSIRPSNKGINFKNFNILRRRSNDFDINKKYRHLWIQCENCYGLNYKKFFRSKMHICEECGYHVRMSSSDRIELLIDSGTWEPMDEDMVSTDFLNFHSEAEPYRDRIKLYQRRTGLTEAIQTGIGQLNGISTAIGVMDFKFMGGSMGSVVGEKLTRLIEYATNRSLPVIIVCASGGARMQEGSVSLMQMAKISSALYNYQSTKKFFYVSILTSPTTGGVTASFGMLGDVIVAEPGAYIAFAGKRVIEQTLNRTMPDGSQAAEHLFRKGLFDSIVPRNPLKGILSELFQLHGFFPLNRNFKN